MNAEFINREGIRRQEFEHIWDKKLDAVFSDVAPYYDRANVVASLGLIDMLRRNFLSTINTSPGQKVLDVCAGTNANGIELLKREPTLQVYAVDRSKNMLKTGDKMAQVKGFYIKNVIGDARDIPFPNNYFDVVTLSFASRHLMIADVFSEIHRVLKPGGHFYHCDMLRPGTRVVEELYYVYLKLCLYITARIFGSGSDALECKDYFIKALRMFYSSEEISELLFQIGYSNSTSKNIFAGMLAFHKACKA